ncbi:MAG: YraN family protein [Kosmotoga sp.]|nr:MAG: YraN family protein [Kosmotoga sp.]
MSRITGKEYEEIACRYLDAKGFDILERNLNYGFAEIDIIAKFKKILVFVEVKGGNPDFPPRLRINRKKLKKIEMAANRYISSNKPCFDSCRIDVIEVLSNGRINHIDGVGGW